MLAAVAQDGDGPAALGSAGGALEEPQDGPASGEESGPPPPAKDTGASARSSKSVSKRASAPPAGAAVVQAFLRRTEACTSRKHVVTLQSFCDVANAFLTAKLKPNSLSNGDKDYCHWTPWEDEEGAGGTIKVKLNNTAGALLVVSPCALPAPLLPTRGGGLLSIPSAERRRTLRGARCAFLLGSTAHRAAAGRHAGTGGLRGRQVTRAGCQRRGWRSPTLAL